MHQGFIRGLASLSLLIGMTLNTGCATPQKKTSSRSKPRTYRNTAEAIPTPMLKDRSGMFNEDRARTVVIGQRQKSAMLDHAAIAEVKTVRLIDMRYMLNMFEQNNKARIVSEMLDKRDSEIRDCYSDRIEQQPGLRGTLNFSFRTSRKRPGLHAIQRAGGSINDPYLEGCIAAELQRIPFGALGSGRGILRYSFRVVNQTQTVTTPGGIGVR